MGNITVLRTKEEIPDPVPNGVYVVIDVFRFSTSVLTLLEEGATSVKPAGSVAEAREFKRQHGDAVVGGELRHSEAAFEITNSPTRISRTDVAGRPASLYSDNGAKALERVRGQGEILLGTTLNAGAVGAELADRQTDVYLVAAGAGGEVRYEDVIAADAIKRYATDPAGVDEDVYRLAMEGVRAQYDSEGLNAADGELVTEINASDTVPRVNAEGHVV